MKILAIESSCDETGIAIIEVTQHYNTVAITNLAHTLHSQATMHAAYGGVFPTLAKREHAKNMVPLITKALSDAGMLAEATTRPPQETIGELMKLLEREQELFVHLALFFASYGKPKIDAIAVTYGPGLEPALWVGINCAKALAHVWNVPLIPVNHMEGHIYAAITDPLNEKRTEYQIVPQKLPVLSLLVSGAHSEWVLSEKLGTYTVLGHTRDDAAGECFDKCARLLGLPYPGGPEISKLAARARSKKLTKEFELPRPMLHNDSPDVSFSGLKTALLRITEKNTTLTDEQKEQLSCEVEDAIVDVLVDKTRRAIQEHNPATFVLSGGVSANTQLVSRLTTLITEEFPEVCLKISPRNLSTDNAFMIACAAAPHALAGEFVSAELIQAKGNLSLESTGGPTTSSLPLV